MVVVKQLGQENGEIDTDQTANLHTLEGHCCHDDDYEASNK